MKVYILLKSYLWDDMPYTEILGVYLNKADAELEKRKRGFLTHDIEEWEVK